MAVPQNFRSAFNGFNREDVVNYISYITNRHETELSDLKTQLRQTEQEKETLKAQLNQQTEDGPETENLRRELEKCRAELAEKDRKLADQEAQMEELTAAPAEKKKPAPVKQELPHCTEEELAAYRRAESAERRARERVNQMFDKACGALSDISVNLEGTTGKISRLEETLLKNLADLEQVIMESKTELADTAVTIGSIRPDQE